jgi:predicted nucleic acid-binding protein
MMLGRVVLDPQILFRSLSATEADQAAREIVQAGILGRYRLLVPEPLLNGAATSLAHGLPRLPLSAAEQAEFLAILADVSEPIATIPVAIPAILGDSRADALLAYAVVAQAKMLVTAERTLLALDEVEGVQILAPQDFLRQISPSWRTAGHAAGPG